MRGGVREGFEFPVTGLEFGGAFLDALLEFGVQLAELKFETLAFHGIKDGAGEIVATDVDFGDEILGAALDQLEGKGIVVQAGEHDNSHAQSMGPRANESLHAETVRQSQIEKNGIDLERVEVVEALGEGVDSLQVENMVAGFGQRLLNEPSVGGIVFDEKNLGYGMSHCFPLGSLTMASQKSSM
jgi:hypothetical protein